jgi:hypothetical protein
MKFIKVFIIDKKENIVKYNPELAAAIIDHRVTGLKLDLNGGYDWVDQQSRILKLLLERKQVARIKTNSDLIACSGYIEHLKNVAVSFRIDEKCPCQASEKRINAAIEKINKMNIEGL